MSHHSRVSNKMAVEVRNIKLVQEIKKYPFLYNYKDVDYSRKDLADAAWNEIGRKFKMSGLAVKKKWQNFRTVLAVHLKRKGSLRERPYYLGKYMEFAVPFMRRSGIIPESFKDPSIPLDIDEDSIEPPSAEPMTPATPQPSGTQRKQDTDEAQPQGDIDSSSYSKPAENSSSNGDCNKMFLLSLLSDMNQMNSSQTRLFKRKVLGLMESIMEGSSPAQVRKPSIRQEYKEETEELFDEESNGSYPLLL
uniref:MADF domain-containing protein n=1 Tax=Heliothis virescens TaxID=7102 RepID=A0A2A4IVN5_HELVI